MTSHNDTKDQPSRVEEVLAEYMMRIDRGEEVDREAFIAEHSDVADALRAYFEDCDNIGRDLDAINPTAMGEPHCESSKPPQTLGDYVLLEKIGQGGMGVVYKACHERLGKTVAVKVLAKKAVSDPDAISRFKREMQAVAALDHPNIVRAYDAREIDGTHFFAMEYIDGVDLSEIVRRYGELWPVP